MNLAKVILIAFTLGMIGIIHMGFQPPSKPPESAYVKQLHEMMRNCEPAECEVIEHLIIKETK